MLGFTPAIPFTCHMKTQVAIVGAGPAGLLLSHLLDQLGIESVIIENKSRDYIEARIRAGVLETQSVDLLVETGLGDRLKKEGLEHHGIYLQTPGERVHINFNELIGKTVWVYGQTEVTKDLNQARDKAGQVIYYSASEVALHGIESAQPSVTFLDADGNPQVIEALYIAGCDGFHGISRASIPSQTIVTYERNYNFGWLGVMADVAPSTDELIYAWHPNGFAMHSMRSKTRSRLYLQVDPDEDIKNWSDDRIWSELAKRMHVDGWHLQSGPIIEKGITPMRSFVTTPMRYGNLFLAGDAAHIVPPTGAKGLNLAIADVKVLSTALARALHFRDTSLIDSYSETALARVWRSTYFSWWMTSMLHTSGNGDPFDDQLQSAQIKAVVSSPSAMAALAENYVGIPFASQG